MYHYEAPSRWVLAILASAFLLFIGGKILWHSVFLADEFQWGGVLFASPFLCLAALGAWRVINRQKWCLEADASEIRWGWQTKSYPAKRLKFVELEEIIWSQKRDDGRPKCIMRAGKHVFLPIYFEPVGIAGLMKWVEENHPEITSTHQEV